jgi:small GTP-binding protein
MQGVGAVPIDIVVIGASGTGKTRLIKRFLHGNFADEVPEEPNTGGKNSCHIVICVITRTGILIFNLIPLAAVYYSKTLALKRYTYKFKIWDTAGAEKYQFLLSMYYSSSKAAMICFDPLMEVNKHHSALFTLNSLLTCVNACKTSS